MTFGQMVRATLVAFFLTALLLWALPAAAQTLDYDHNDAWSPDGRLHATWTVRGEGLRVTPPDGERVHRTVDTLHGRGAPDLPGAGQENSVHYQCASNTARGTVWYGINSRDDVSRQIRVVCFTHGAEPPPVHRPIPDPEPEPDP